MSKTIEIKCRGAGTLALNLLTPSQGNLKTLSDANYYRLRTEILNDGFIEPISVWEDPETAQIFILNGHQRYQVLSSLRDEGFALPEIPVSYTEASSLADAKRKILAMASQYGTMTNGGLQDMISELGLSREAVDQFFNFPDVDLDFVLSNMEAPIIVGDSAPGVPVIGSDEPPPLPRKAPEVKHEVKEEEKKGQKHCPHCGSIL